LTRYGLPVGLKNYSAAYCTGLLVARRLLKQLGLDEVYSGVEEPTGEIPTTENNGHTYYVNEVDEDKKPFRCFLDVGIKNTTTGARVFAALKGASDGGLDIPHSNKRFPGYVRETKAYDAATHKARIMGEHVADYMRDMQEDDDEMYKKYFASYLENDIDADGVEEMYEKVHAAIRENPDRAKAPAFTGIDKSFKKPVKRTYEQRRAAVAVKKAALRNADDE